MIDRIDRSGPRRRRTGGSRSSGLAPSRRIARPGQPLPVRFTASASGHAVLHLVSTPLGHGPALLRIDLDGRPASHAVVPASGRSIPSAIVLGPVAAGPHLVEVAPTGPFSPEAAIEDTALVLAPEDSWEGSVLRHAPILVGRSLPELGGPYQNVVTDTPLLAWHDVRPAGPDGSRLIEYTVLWSHEDGGTDAPTLLARWGRTTDIEWVYRVVIARDGGRIPGTAWYQGRGHLPRPFAGRFDGDRPLLQVATDNNMVSDRVRGVLRFALAPDSTLPPGRPREIAMALHPWTFRLSAAEVRVAGLVERRPDPSGRSVADPRDYVYLELSTARRPAGRPGSGLAVAVRLRGSRRSHRSDDGLVDRTITRDGAVATAIRLPSGARPDDLVEIVALRVPRAGAHDEIGLEGAVRGFFLDRRFMPGIPIAYPVRKTVLTDARPRAVLWSPRSVEGPGVAPPAGLPGSNP